MNIFLNGDSRNSVNTPEIIESPEPEAQDAQHPRNSFDQNLDSLRDSILRRGGEEEQNQSILLNDSLKYNLLFSSAISCTTALTCVLSTVAYYGSKHIQSNSTRLNQTKLPEFSGDENFTLGMVALGAFFGAMSVVSFAQMACKIYSQNIRNEGLNAIQNRNVVSASLVMNGNISPASINQPEGERSSIFIINGVATRNSASPFFEMLSQIREERPSIEVVTPVEERRPSIEVVTPVEEKSPSPTILPERNPITITTKPGENLFPLKSLNLPLRPL